MLPPIPVVYGPMPFYHHPPLPPPPMGLRPAVHRADKVLPPSQMMKHRAADMPYPAFAPPVMQPPMMMQHPRMQPM
uniref:Uncharacterized protein n=1 Tax=Romanomermis culicivorax TaxID=13658 RepID=A0A915LBA6_ROMCU